MITVEIDKAKGIKMHVKGSKIDLMSELGELIGYFLDQVSTPEKRERDKAIICKMIHECL